MAEHRHNHRGKRILVTGATGQQGGAVVRHLRQKDFLVRALTRDPAAPKARALAGPGVEVVAGDQNDIRSLENAMDEVNGVFGVQTSYGEGGTEAEIREGKNLIDAARKVVVDHFVYSSVGSADQSTGIPHFDSKFEIEEHLRRSGLRYTIVRPVFFMENWIAMKGMLASGAITLPLSPDTRLQQIAVDDIGGIVTLAFQHPGKWGNRAVDIAGDEHSMTETAAMFSRMLVKDIKYQQVPWEAFEKQVGHDLAVMYRWFEQVGYKADIPALHGEYHLLRNLERWLLEHRDRLLRG